MRTQVYAGRWGKSERESPRAHSCPFCSWFVSLLVTLAKTFQSIGPEIKRPKRGTVYVVDNEIATG